MDKETIFYSIMHRDAEAVKIIPELEYAYNMTSHRIKKLGETITIPINNTIGELKCITGKDYIHSLVNLDEIKLVWENNPTNATREARIILLLCYAGNCKKLLQFAIHLN